MPQQARKASTAASAKIAKDATAGSRKRKNSNNPEEQEQKDLTSNTEENVSQENGVNNNNDVDNSEAPPDKKRKTDDNGKTDDNEDNHQHNGNNIDHNGDAAAHDLQESHHDHDQEMTEREPDTSDDHYENGDHHKDNGNLTSQVSQEPEPEPVQKQTADTEKKDELAMKMTANTLEKGHVGVDNPTSIDDVQRMYMVLIPYLVRPSLEKDPISSFAQELSAGKLEAETEAAIGKTRVIILGKKKLPEINKHDCFWGFVGRGVYNIVDHHNRTHLAYVLEVPENPFQLQLDFNVGKKGSYALTVKNSDVANPRNAGLTENEKVKFPEHLMNHFSGRRFISFPTTNFLDYNGAEVLLIGARNDIADELGQEVGGELEEFAELELKSLVSFDDQGVFDELHLEKDIIPTEPAFHGLWK
ncbi:4429_t:CDS:2 [Dentiscutata erythropus]|uniref:4429_t:CDS:1 n=1 Tax=Dentiscutata erythropus TaxID=1348616 RepID=A0A9N9NGM4_9GLOM|nr:4429_t:CDS:2 [Dentiscutata erythropus]